MMLTTIQILTIIGLILEFLSFLIFVYEFLLPFSDLYGRMNKEDWTKQRRNSFIGVVLLLVAFIIQGYTAFI